MPTIDADFTHQVLQAVMAVQGLYIAGRSTGEVFDSMLQEVLDLTESEYGYIGEVVQDPDGTPYLLAHSLTDISWDDASRELVEQAKLHGGFAFRNLDTLYGRVLTSGEAIIANDAPNDPRSGGTAPGHLPLDRFLGLPLWSEGDIVGSVGVSNRPGGYDQELVAAIEPLMVSCGTMIRAFRARQELEASQRNLEQFAKTLREGLLPPELPSIGWLDIAAKFRAASDGFGVTGDFYDVFQTRAGRWYFVVGDVQGHGPPAARTTSLARWTLQAKAAGGLRPDELILELNRQLLARTGADRPHISVVVAVVDLEESGGADPLRVEFCTAGHPPPMVRRGDGKVEHQSPHGTVLGLFEDVGLRNRSIELGRGDAILFYTDGVLEARDNDLLHAEVALANKLTDASLNSATAITDMLLDIDDEQLREHDDDAAALVLRLPNA